MSAQPNNRADMGIPTSIRLVLPYPLSSNRYWSSRAVPSKANPKKHIVITHPSSEAQAYKQEVQLLALRAGVRKPIVGNYHVQMQLYPNRPQDFAKRARKDPDGWEDTVQCIDLGNCEKVLSDALNGIAWVDDKQARRIELERMTPDEHGPRVVVTISQIHAQPIAPELF